MDIIEARKIALSVNNDTYPPTNPAVLLEAARTLYLERGSHVDIGVILMWTLNVMVNNSQGAFTTQQGDYIVGLMFAERVKEDG